MRCKMENLSLIYKVENYILFLGMKNVIQLSNSAEIIGDQQTDRKISRLIKIQVD